eukprot:CAMPEP_0171629368 /NCGR_PEP_ID=MMETSP0990-20121206/22128_1 /TAXON_ID=483369 /ORGANISM="non described non described, Strain CCMP2098" /LENGTH=31 /DNA_ID= /DNA_START= /DNA_END= /DNA_ORIENTATION=
MTPSLAVVEATKEDGRAGEEVAAAAVAELVV